MNSVLLLVIVITFILGLMLGYFIADKQTIRRAEEIEKERLYRATQEINSLDIAKQWCDG